MGTNKLLLPFAGSTVLGRVVDAYLEAGAHSVVVVVRPDEVAMRAALAGRAVTFVENPDAEGDMLSSVRCGLRALPESVQTIAVSPGDQPALTATTVRGMLEVFQTTARIGPQAILVPVHQGRRGHPLIFAARYRDELLTSHDGVGLRGLLERHAGEFVEWVTEDAAVLQDLDTRADYERACRPKPDSADVGRSQSRAVP